MFMECAQLSVLFKDSDFALTSVFLKRFTLYFVQDFQLTCESKTFTIHVVSIIDLKVVFDITF